MYCLSLRKLVFFFSTTHDPIFFPQPRCDSRAREEEKQQRQQHHLREGGAPQAGQEPHVQGRPQELGQGHRGHTE